jgi:predicted transcriptional regulator
MRVDPSLGGRENLSKEQEMKCQVVLDSKSKTLLDELAKPRGNNRSFVVREALRVFAAMETYLDELERDPAFQRAMNAGLADIAAGRLHSHREARQLVARKRR